MLLALDLIPIPYAGPYLSGKMSLEDDLQSRFEKYLIDKERSVDKIIYRYNALSLLKNQLFCLGLSCWNGETTNIESLQVDQANIAQETALHLAVTQDNVASVRALLAARASTEIRNTNGQTALHLAAELGNEVIIQTLLAEKANPDVVDKDGRSCLDMAAVHDSCSAALKRIGADGWTPLMVAAEKGGPALEEYLLCRNYCLSIKNRVAFPEIFCREVQFYSGLLTPKTSKLEWGRKWNMNVIDNNYVVATYDEAKVSCALGKDEFEIGIHTWKVCLSDFRGMAWIGVARYSEELACDPRTLKSCEKSYAIYFESSGAEGVVGLQPSNLKPVHFDQIRDSAFSAGQTVELLLDTFKSSLELRIDGLTKTMAFNIDDAHIHPYVCFENLGSATILESTSRCSNIHSVISAEERTAGCDNSLWSSDLDKALEQCFKFGTRPSLLFLFFYRYLG
jgi:hypothetical protein